MYEHSTWRIQAGAQQVCAPSKFLSTRFFYLVLYQNASK